MEVSWIIPAAVETYAERERIQGIWENIVARFRGKNYRLAVTGGPGVGKTVLLEHLTGKAIRVGYKAPGTSQSLERGKLAQQGKRLALSVIPGQQEEPRLLALDKIFEGRHAVAGVIHVVCNGFVAIRNEDARGSLIKNGVTTLEQFRDRQLKQEIEDLKETLSEVRQSIRKKGKPRWMLVAVGKSDLYNDSLSKARTYYSPDGDSPFVDELRRFSAQVGSDNFRWTACPVSALLEDFEWNGEQVKHQLQTRDRDSLLSQFMQLLGEYCTE